jgi:hypothetical protein
MYATSPMAPMRESTHARNHPAQREGPGRRSEAAGEPGQLRAERAASTL